MAAINERSKEVELIELTPEEIERAILNEKIAKYHREKNRPYYEALEKIKPKEDKRKKTI